MSFKAISILKPEQVNSIQDVFVFRKYVRDLKDLKNNMILIPHISDTIHNSIREVIKNLNEEIKTQEEILLTIEQKYGCNHCGAMSNEDCRTSSEVGYCVAFEDFKEENA